MMGLLKFNPERRARDHMVVFPHNAGHRAACRDCRWLSIAHPDAAQAERAGVDHFLAAHFRKG